MAGARAAGGRVIYIHHDANHPIFLLAAFTKNEKSKLSKAERKEMAKFVKALFKPTGGDV